VATLSMDKNIYFILQSTQQFIKIIYFESRISEAQHISIRNGSSSGTNSSLLNL
jgi:K+-transporting ATPase c subunit